MNLFVIFHAKIGVFYTQFVRDKFVPEMETEHLLIIYP